MRPERLYTMILEYKGGTYISQARAESADVAVSKWANAISDHDLASWGLTRAEIIRLANDNPIPLESCLNVWCATDSTKEGLMLVNIIATEHNNKRPTSS